MKSSAAISAAPGMVRIQAHTTRPATPQRTADRRWMEPTPTMQPVMVCVVDTGMPLAETKNSVAAAADSAETPPAGCRPSGGVWRAGWCGPGS